MAKPEFDPKNALGAKLLSMEKKELCSFVSALCRSVVSEVGSRGRRGGIYPDNISLAEDGSIAVGPAGKPPWTGEDAAPGQELDYISPELYWNGQLSAASDVYSVGMLMYYALSGGKLPLAGVISVPRRRRASASARSSKRRCASRRPSATRPWRSCAPWWTATCAIWR